MMNAGDPLPANADIVYGLRSLPLVGTVLHVGAHPDDEDSGTLAYLSRGLGLRTVYWSATRGEGGQNRLGPEKAEALGIVRTWESLAAREVDGAEVRYGPFYDFGFSKSGDEALAKWGRDDVVRELVRAIRTVRPQVVISRWSGDPGDGHGQHQAIGMVVEEAFETAADPDRWPELARHGAAAWQASKLYRSMHGDWQPGEDVTLGAMVPEYEVANALRINTGDLDPVSGRTYQELAAIGRNRHRTQAMAELPEAGDHFSYYSLLRSSVPVSEREGGFFDGLETDLAAMAGFPGGGPGLRPTLEEASARARDAIRIFDPWEPTEAGEAVLQGLEALREAQRAASGGPDGTQERGDAPVVQAALRHTVRSFEEVAARCLGLRVECLVDPRRVVPGETVRVNGRVWCLGGLRADDVRLDLELPAGWTARPVDGRAPEADPDGRPLLDAWFDVEVPESAELSCPYWLRQPRGPYRYAWPEDERCGLPFDEPLVRARAEVALGPHRLSVAAAGVRRETFAGGSRELPLAVLPPMALKPREQAVILPTADEERGVELQVSVRATREEGAKGDLSLEVPDGWQARPADVGLVLPRGGESRTVRFRVEVPGDAAPGAYRMGYGIASGEHRHGVVLQPVWQGAPGVPRPADEATCVAEAFVLAPATVRVHLVDAAFVRTLRYAYVMGVDDDVLSSLSRFGLDMTLLPEEELPYADLGSFDAIVVGPNAYLVREDVRAAAGRLLDYVATGGTLIVQYQAYGYEAAGYAPYPFRYHQPHGRVTFPDAPVTVLEPEHPILHLPNTISDQDFDGWTHDRGLYFFGEWDRRYVPVLECHDPGDGPQRGGLLVASYGQGTWVYAAYSLFRQLPAGVPGAIRLFANLLGIAEARILERMARARAVPLFSFMTDEQLHDVVRLMSERWYDDGAFLAREGEPGSELFLVLEGEVEILKADDERAGFVAGEGEVVGELAVLTEAPRSASLRARGGVKVLSVRGDHFRALLKEHWDLTDGVIRMLADRLAGRG
jgi:LmbE family N-acetylglucosaminyl deacetylase